jgi:hypothetical protein
MPAIFKFEGTHAHLVSAEEAAAAIKAAEVVFASHNVDPLACADACRKLANDELLTQEEALLNVIWDMAEDQAFRAATHGWLIRDVDLRLVAGPAP